MAGRSATNASSFIGRWLRALLTTMPCSGTSRRSMTWTTISAPRTSRRSLATYRASTPTTTPSPSTTWPTRIPSGHRSGDSRFSLTSFQFYGSYAGHESEVEEWRQKTASAGRPLPIGMDELTPATTTNAADMRRGVLWPTYLSGGNLEWYIGSEDQSLEDFRRYGELWAYTRHARTFMEDNLPFWEMQPQDGLLLGESSDYGGGQVFTKASEVYAVYLPNASSTGTLDLSGASGSFQKRWYNPRSGAFEGSTQAVSGGTITSLGAPPSSTSSDWVVLIEAIG